MSYVIRICYVIVHVHDHKNVYGSSMYVWVYIYIHRHTCSSNVPCIHRSLIRCIFPKLKNSHEKNI